MREDVEAALLAMDPKTVGRRLKQARLDAGLTQSDTVRDDASAAFWSRIERGERRASPQLFERICMRLGTTPEEVVLGTPPADSRALECEVDFAELALLSGTPADALDRAERLLSTAPPAEFRPFLARVQLVRASALAALEDAPGAITAFEQLVSSDPPGHLTTQAAMRLSRLLRETGDVHRSITVAEKELARLDQTGDAVADDTISLSVTLAAAYWENGDIARALIICKQAITASELSGSPAARAAAYWNTAIIESEAGRLDEALGLTRRAMALFEGDSDLRLHARLRTQLAELLLRVDPPQTDEAVRHLVSAEQALRFAAADVPELLHTRLTLAKAHLAAGDIAAAQAEATSCLEQAVGLPFVAATAAKLLGNMAIETNDVNEAKIHFTEAVRHLSGAGADRRAAQLWFDLGSALDQVGFADQAKDAYRRAAVSTGLATPRSANQPLTV